MGLDGWTEKDGLWSRDNWRWYPYEVAVSIEEREIKQAKELMEKSLIYQTDLDDEAGMNKLKEATDFLKKGDIEAFKNHLK